MKFGERVKNFFYKTFSRYKIREALANYLRDYIDNSRYFSLRDISFTGRGFSMALGYDPEKAPSERQPISFFDYLPKYYQNLYNSVEGFGNRISEWHRKVASGLEDAIGKSFSSDEDYSGGLKLRWAAR